MISKELLSEVLDTDVISFGSFVNNKSEVTYPIEEKLYVFIKVSELESAMKQWLLEKQGIPFNLSGGLGGYSIILNLCFRGLDFGIMSKSFDGYFKPNYIILKKEIDVLNQACQWILDNRDEI